MKELQAGVVQFDVRTGKTGENIETALRGINALADQGIELVVLPEMCTSGFDYDHLKDHAKKTPEILKLFQQTAKERNLVIAASMPEFDKGRVFNTFYIIERDGELSGSYRKIHLFTLTGEDKHFKKGSAPLVCKSSAGNIGLMICYDLRFPELCRRLKQDGAQIILISAQWPRPRIEHWDILIRARAIENQVFVIAANRSGKSHGLDFPGHSQIVSPWGKVLAKNETGEGLLAAKLSVNEINEAEKTIPCLDARVPEAYL